MAKVKKSKSSGSLRKQARAKKRNDQSATDSSAPSSKATKKSASKKKAVAVAKEPRKRDKGAPEKGASKAKARKLKASLTAGAGNPRKWELMGLLTKLAADFKASEECVRTEIQSLVDELELVSGRLKHAERNIEKLEERLLKQPPLPSRVQKHTLHVQRNDGKNEPLDPLRSRAGAMSDSLHTSPVNLDAALALGGFGKKPKKR